MPNPMDCYDDFYIQKRKENLKFAAGMAAIFTALVLAFVLLAVNAHAEVIIDLDAIAQIESSGCKNKISKRPGDESYGCHQITPGTLSEFNAYNKKSYTKSDLLDDKISEEVAGWYLNKRIPSMIRHFKKSDTVDNRLIAYNAGIAYVKNGKPLPAITKKYLEKYARLTK